MVRMLLQMRQIEFSWFFAIRVNAAELRSSDRARFANYMIGFHVLHSPTVTGAPTEPARRRMMASVVEQ